MLQNRKTYYYKLEDIDINGTATMHGPVSATPRLIYGDGEITDITSIGQCAGEGFVFSNMRGGA